MLQKKKKMLSLPLAWLSLTELRPSSLPTMLSTKRKQQKNSLKLFMTQVGIFIELLIDFILFFIICKLYVCIRQYDDFVILHNDLVKSSQFNEVHIFPRFLPSLFILFDSHRVKEEKETTHTAIGKQ